MLAEFLFWYIPTLLLIALLLACAIWAAVRCDAGSPRIGWRGDTTPADPFLFPFGEVPTVPRERFLLAHDFRTWRVPPMPRPSAGALRRNESGGRPVSRSGTAVVLNFRKVRR